MHRTHDLAKGCTLPPQHLKPCRVGGRIPDRVLHLPVSEIVLNQPRVCALVSQSEATGVGQHARVGFDGQPCKPNHVEFTWINYMLQKPILLLAVSGSTSSRVQIFRHGAARNPLDTDILMPHLGKDS